MTPTPKTAILDLLQSVRGGPLPVRALVAAGALLGLEANGVRVALARLVARGLVERAGPGRYRLAAGAQPISRWVGSWSSVDPRTVRWDGAWVAVHVQGHAGRERAARRRDARALGFLGFAALRAGLSLRPDNLRGGVGETRRALHALGLAPELAVFRLTDLDAAIDRHARQLWDVERIVRGQRRMRQTLERSAARLGRLAREAAMVETFLVGGRAIRQLALDPCLPEAIAPEAERDALVAALREYDRAGRACWRDFMREHGAPHRAAPANLAALYSGNAA